MKILFLAFELPYPLDRGGRIKTYHYLRALAKHHRVTLVALSRSPQEQQCLDHFAGWLEAAHLAPIDLSLTRKARVAGLGLWSRKPFVISLYDDRRARRLVSDLLTQDYDLVYADHLHVSQYVPESLQALKVLDQHNIETMILNRFLRSRGWGALKAFAWWEWKRMAAYEPAECRRFDMVLVTSAVDAELIRPWLHSRGRLEILPIGVDVTYFEPAPRPSHARTMVALGTLAWQPNADGVLWFCNEVLPQVRDRVPDFTLQIIGDHPPRALRRLADEESAVELLGWVADVRPYLARSAGLVVPLRIGSGMRVKVLNALAMGVPVVSTTVGCEGIGVTPGRDALIGDDPQSLAQAVVTLVSDQGLQQRLSTAGRALAMGRYAWPVVYDQIGRVFAEMGDVQRLA